MEKIGSPHEACIVEARVNSHDYTYLYPDGMFTPVRDL